MFTFFLSIFSADVQLPPGRTRVKLCSFTDQYETEMLALQFSRYDFSRNATGQLCRTQGVRSQFDVMVHFVGITNDLNQRETEISGLNCGVSTLTPCVAMGYSIRKGNAAAAADFLTMRVALSRLDEAGLRLCDTGTRKLRLLPIEDFKEKKKWKYKPSDKNWELPEAWQIYQISDVFRNIERVMNGLASYPNYGYTYSVYQTLLNSSSFSFMLLCKMHILELHGPKKAGNINCLYQVDCSTTDRVKDAAILNVVGLAATFFVNVFKLHYSVEQIIDLIENNTQESENIVAH